MKHGGSIFTGLPVCYSKAEGAAMFIAFGLSLSLFGLTILEALPVSTQTSLSNQATISFAYWITFWILSFYILFVVPSLIGASVAISFGHYFCCTPSPTKSDNKKYSVFDSRKLPWCIRFVSRLAFGLVIIIVKNILCNGYYWCCSGHRRRNLNDSSVLPLREESVVHCMPEEIRDDLSPAKSHRNKKRSTVDSSSSTSKKYDCLPNHHTSRHQRFVAAIGGICGIVLVLGLISTIGPLVVQLPSTKQTSILSLIVSWLCGVGLLISSILNGFGSVSLPYTTLSGFFLQQIRPDCMTKLESDLNNMHKILTEKQQMLKELKVQIPMLNTSRSMNQSSLPGSSVKTFSMVSLLIQNNTNSGFSDLGVELKKRRQILNKEISFMEDLVRETSLDLEELKHSQMTAAAARTSVGKTKLYVGLIFSCLLLIRLFNAGYSIFYSPHLHKKSRSDIVTSILLWLTGHHYFSHNQYNMLSQITSLVLSALLSFSQVRTFLRTATIVHRRLSRLYKKFFCADDNMNGTGLFSDNPDQHQNENFLWWMISALLGCYSLACIVLIKMMLPERFSVAFSMALDETNIFTIRSSVVDTVFLSSAVISALILGMLLGIQQQNISKHVNTLSKSGSNVMITPLLDV